MNRYIKKQRSEPTSEEFIALAILLGPLAWLVRWAWRHRVLVLLAGAVLAGCTEDVGARLQRECASVVKAAIAAERRLQNPFDTDPELPRALKAEAERRIAVCVAQRARAFESGR